MLKDDAEVVQGKPLLGRQVLETDAVLGGHLQGLGQQAGLLGGAEVQEKASMWWPSTWNRAVTMP